MHDFRYCVWLTTDNDCMWSRYTNGFKPHLTIKSHLSFDEAFSLQNDGEGTSPRGATPPDISSNFYESLEIYLDSSIINSKSPDFHALYFGARLGDSIITPHWWPEYAHVSFYYGYDEINDSVVEELTKTITN